MSQRGLLQDLRDDAGADGAATLTDSEAELLFHGDRNDELNVHVDVVARHHHFRAFRQGHDARHVSRTEVELGTIVAEERSEEHTSELQSRENLVCRLLLEKKKKMKKN